MSESRWMWGRGLVLALCLLLVHVGVWRPVRNAFVRHVAAPLVAAVDTERAASFHLDAVSYDRTLVAQPVGRGADEEVEQVYRSPANLDYLLPALILIAVFPTRLYWFYLWLAHVALGGVALPAFAVGVGWTDVGFLANTFIRVYLARAVSLAALALAFAPHLLRTSEQSRAAQAGQAS